MVFESDKICEDFRSCCLGDHQELESSNLISDEDAISSRERHSLTQLLHGELDEDRSCG